jgi:hypothetical protein
MNRLCLERSRRSEMAVSRSGILAATFAAAILANAVTWTVALAQQPGAVTQQRDEAPIGYVQPRVAVMRPAPSPKLVPSPDFQGERGHASGFAPKDGKLRLV